MIYLETVLTFSALVLGTLGKDISTKQDNYRILTINEGDNLEISCSTKDPIKFLYPSGTESSHRQIITSNFTILQDESSSDEVIHIFRRPKAIHGDTGFYGCLNLKGTRTHKFIKRTPYNLTYFYVKSKTNAFVEELSVSIHYGPEGSDLHINCRPTSPNLHVELEHYYRGNRTVLTRDPSVSFNPTYGFELRNATLTNNSGLYVCKTINEEGNHQELQYLYKINKKTKINEPQIGIEDTDRHVVHGQTLRLKCYIVITNVTNYTVNWESPMNQTSQFVNYIEMDSNKLLVQNYLLKTNVKPSDEGYYRCLFRNYDVNITKVDETYIKIHDPSFKYLNLTTDRMGETFLRSLGDQVLWIVEIGAYPIVNIKWFNPKGEIITESEKFKVFNSQSTTGLIIKDINLSDTGVYLVKVSNEVDEKILKFHLEIDSF